MSDSILVTCPTCRTLNRVPTTRPSGSAIPICGRCRSPLQGSRSETYGSGHDPTVKRDRTIAIAAVVILAVILIGYIAFQGTGSVSKKPVVSATAPHARPISQSPRPAEPKTPPISQSPRAVAPKPAPKPDNRLPNGTLIRSITLDGLGELEVKNGLYQDAAIKLVKTGSNQCAAYFYVRASGSHTVSNIPNGTYCLKYMIGKDWNEAKQRFNRDVKGSAFDKLLEYTTEQRHEGNQIYTQYHTMSVTLHRVPQGNATTHNISADEFNQE